MGFHSKETTKIMGFREGRDKISYGLEEEEEVKIPRRLNIFTLHVTLCR
jgi:hypothetical protein